MCRTSDFPFPSLILSHWAPPDSILCGDLRRFRVLAPLGPKKWPSKRPSKTDQILIERQHRFLNVLAPFWRPRRVPKPIKNLLKLNFQAFLFPHRFLHRFLIDFSSQLGTQNAQRNQTSMPRFIPSWIPFLDRFLLDFWSHLDHLNPIWH